MFCRSPMVTWYIHVCYRSSMTARCVYMYVFMTTWYISMPYRSSLYVYLLQEYYDYSTRVYSRELLLRNTKITVSIMTMRNVCVLQEHWDYVIFKHVLRECWLRDHVILKCVLQEYYDYAMRVIRYEFQSLRGSVFGKNPLTRIHDFNTGQCRSSNVSTT